MSEASEKRRFPSAPTFMLGGAALVAALSVSAAIWKPGARAAHDEIPAAADWRTVGWAYAEKGDSGASAAAYRRAAAIEPDNAENWSSLAEALQSASTEVVPEAAAAIDKALKLDPSDPRARYFLAVQKDLRGDSQGALSDWLALLADTPDGAPWRADLVRTIEQTAARSRIDVRARLAKASSSVPVSAAIPGPSADQLASASAIPPERQAAMAEGMVERLAARLAAQPRDADGWIRLMRSRMVLGQPARAREALAAGLGAFAGDSATQERLRSAAAQLGVSGG